MSFQPPQPGTVIRYSYLWGWEEAEGREEGSKDRPCAIVLHVEDIGGDETKVVVLPITHSPPTDDFAMEIPLATKLRLGLDSDRSWIVFSENNEFTWPGPDLRPAVNGDFSTIVYGILPETFFAKLLQHFVAAYAVKKSKVIKRTE